MERDKQITGWDFEGRSPYPQAALGSYGDESLPTGLEPLDEPFRAFPSWFLHRTGRHGDPRYPRSHAAAGQGRWSC
jgi:hypothetical protein